MKDEALRLALEALNDRASLMKWQRAREAVEQALGQPKQKDEKGRPMTYWGGLEQPEPEPAAWDVYEHRVYGLLGEKRHRVLWVEDYASGDLEKLLEAARNGGIDAQSKTISVKPLYTELPKRKPLTDKQIRKMLGIMNPDEEEIRLIRMGWNAAHGIKE